jgi:putative transferase (TIGR04331 family)
MFLATTALSEFWDRRADVVFLGGWCTPYGSRSGGHGQRARTMPSPWDDRKRFYDAVRYVDECGERMLRRLADYLNVVHGVAHEIRYWRVIVGPWLLHYLHAAYDRWAHLEEASRRYGSFDTIVLDRDSFRTPADGDETIRWLGDDLYNLQIFSQLLAGMGRSFPSRPVPKEASWGATATPTQAGRSLKNVVRRGERALALACRRREWVAIWDVAAPRLDLWRLAWRSRFHVVPLRPAVVTGPTPSPVFDQRRMGMAELSASDEFERLWVNTLPRNFPSRYLEGYRKARTAARRRHSVPRAVVSETGWYGSESFRFMAAEAAAGGSRLVPAQHGGAYGIRRAMPCEWHESRVAGVYVVWGWAAAVGEPYRDLPQPRSQYRRRVIAPGSRAGQTGLFVATSDLRYLHYFHSRPTGSQWLDYFEWQSRFLGALPADIRSRMRFRPLATDCEQFVGKQIRDSHPDVEVDTAGAFAARMLESRLVIIDHCGTALLEAFNADVPTVLFWDPERWEARAEAEPFRARLREARILHDSPEAAAEHAAAVFADPRAWWDQPLVQDARRLFAERFGRAVDDWVPVWAEALKQLWR